MPRALRAGPAACGGVSRGGACNELTHSEPDAVSDSEPHTEPHRRANAEPHQGADHGADHGADCKPDASANTTPL